MTIEECAKASDRVRLFTRHKAIADQLRNAAGLCGDAVTLKANAGSVIKTIAADKELVDEFALWLTGNAGKFDAKAAAI